MLLHSVADTSDELAITAARGAKVARLATLLAAGEGKDETAVVVSWLSGELTQRQIGVGWGSLRDLPEPAEAASLTVRHVEAVFDRLAAPSGPGSQGVRRQLITELFGAATTSEQAFLRRVITGELRQGALVGVMTDAIAKAAGLPLADIRRAAMLSGDLAEIAAVALHDGAAALAGYRPQVGRPISPMLAQTATSATQALASLGRAGLEWKLDGFRVQIHRRDQEVTIFSRTLSEMTARLPSVVEAVRALPVRELVVDGEVIVLRQDGRPLPFQGTASRLTGQNDGSGVAPTAYLFDILALDGADLLDEPAARRSEILRGVVPTTGPVRTTPRLVTDDPEQATRFLAEALAQGHEGIIAKSLDAPYQAGRRGAGWLKVKPVHTLDLVVLAVEWGSGRRQGTLSNIHLGARDGSGFVMIGKTFKGMTDAMLRWQTERFSELATGPTDGWVVPLRPEQVVEIGFDGVQSSSRYPGGVAL
ncbi:MAG: ATP-dependent DNA ligase, partial [Jatrophihabitans sp.]